MRSNKAEREKYNEMLKAKGIDPTDAKARIKYFRDSMPQIVKDILAGKDISNPVC